MKFRRRLTVIPRLYALVMVLIASLLPLQPMADDITDMSVPAPDFSLPVIANGDGSLALEQLEDRWFTSTSGPLGVVPADCRYRR